MGIIKRADLESYTRNAVPMDIGDLHRRGKAVVEAAQNEAVQVLKDAKAQRDKLVSDASKVGTDQGYQEGRAKGIDEGTAAGIKQAQMEHGQRLDALIDGWTKALTEWESERSELMIAARTEVIELAAHIAARVIKRTIDLDPEVVVDQLETILDSLVSATDIRVRAHPGDMELLGRVMPAMVDKCSACNHAQLVEDDTLSPGSCVVTTKGGGTIDASIMTQLDRVVATLLPAHRGPEYDQHLDEGGSTESESKGDAA